MGKLKRISLIFGALFAILLLILVMLQNLTAPLSDEAVFKKMAEDLILINYQNNHKAVIAELPSIVTDSAKVMLLENTTNNYKSRAIHGSITDLEVVIYSQDLAESKKQVIVISKYKELQLYNTAMTSITTFTIQEGRVIEIETHDYTDSVYTHLN